MNVSVTFDNLGEASDLERGWWPEDEPIGHHFSVTRALPRVLDALDDAGLRATFFVEGINAEIYPETLTDLDARGHEVACHGWRHERWDSLGPSDERRALQRATTRWRELGLRTAGFRPPGGGLTPDTAGLLAQLGFSYCSPAQGVDTGSLPSFPFRWELLDAYHYLPHFADRRGQEEPLPPERLRDTLLAALEEPHDHLVLIFHPFLADTDERVRVIRDVLARVRELVDEGAVVCAPCREFVSA